MGDDLERLIRLEATVKQHGDVLEDHGGSLDHVVNTIDSILLPTQKVHHDKLADLRTELDDGHDKVQEIHDYITSQKGAWAFVQKALLIVAAAASVVTLVYKVLGK